MVARFVRDEEAAGSNPVIPTTLNLSNQAVSEVFDLFENPHIFGFDHMLATFYASNAVIARLYKILTLIFCPKSQKIPLLILQIKHTSFSLFKAYHILIYPKVMARIFMSVPFFCYCVILSCAFWAAISAFILTMSFASSISHSSSVLVYTFLAIRLP